MNTLHVKGCLVQTSRGKAPPQGGACRHTRLQQPHLFNSPQPDVTSTRGPQQQHTTFRGLPPSLLFFPWTSRLLFLCRRRAAIASSYVKAIFEKQSAVRVTQRSNIQGALLSSCEWAPGFFATHSAEDLLFPSEGTPADSSPIPDSDAARREELAVQRARVDGRKGNSVQVTDARAAHGLIHRITENSEVEAMVGEPRELAYRTAASISRPQLH